jgi:hypothetical protein
VWKILESFLKHAQIGQSRSSVVNPLQWTLVIVTTPLLFLVFVRDVAVWLVAGFAIADAVVLALLIFAYVFFMMKDPDALRSEKYSLVKTAIEKKVLGDSITGLIESFEEPDAKLLGPGNGQNLGPKT